MKNNKLDKTWGKTLSTGQNKKSTLSTVNIMTNSNIQRFGAKGQTKINIHFIFSFINTYIYIVNIFRTLKYFVLLSTFEINSLKPTLYTGQNMGQTLDKTH